MPNENITVENLTVFQATWKKTWELINELRGKTKNNIKPCFKIDGELIYNQREIAQGFNQYFASIAHNMNTKIKSSRPMQSFDPNKKFIDFLSNQKRVLNSIYLYQCSSEDVFSIIKEFESDKASHISVKVLKRIALYISQHLSGFINYFVDSCTGL